MYINATGFYIPEARVDNQHFLELNGLTSEWIEQRTGIRTRSIAKPEENINTMSMEALRNALPQLPYDITEVDLIISASYSPYDTVATAAHNAQFEFNITNAKALYLSSACSSFINSDCFYGYAYLPWIWLLHDQRSETNTCNKPLRPHIRNDEFNFQRCKNLPSADNNNRQSFPY